MSRGFLCALAGIAMTLFGWYGPWAWPEWPALMAIDLVLGKTGFADYPFAMRSAIVVLLIMLNVAFWAAVIYALIRAAQYALTPARNTSSGNNAQRRRAG